MPDESVVKSCIPVVHSADLEKSLRFWVDGLGLTMDRDYGQTEFFVTDDDGYTHCFGVETTKGA
jgi:catechol 2,3-dioxygenase-like lactoylglutathione lyase family enzyme